MALTRLSDAIVPDVFTAYQVKDTMEKAKVFQSGLVTQDALMASLLAGGGRLFQHPSWGDLADSGSSVATDNPADLISPDKIGSFKRQFVRQFRTKAWSSADLVASLAGSDPQKRIVSKTSEWWAREFDKMAISTLTGIINANIAQNSGDMVKDIRAASGNITIGGVTTAANKIQADAILEAKQTMGDAADYLKIIVMHSRVFTNLQKQQLIVYIPNARGEINIPTYLGYTVLMSDKCPVVSDGSGGFDYTTYLTAPGIIGFAEVAPDMPVEVERKPDQGMGSGVEILYTRRQFGMHVYGFNWNDASIAGLFPTTAELALAANWTRRFPERKQVPFAAILSKG